jgi:hypothetical protein
VEERGVRRILRRQLRAGSLPPVAILAPLGWTHDTTAALTVVDGPAVLRAALADAINRHTPTPHTTPLVAAPAPVVAVAATSGHQSDTPDAVADLSGEVSDVAVAAPDSAPANHLDNPPTSVTAPTPNADRTGLRWVERAQQYLREEAGLLQLVR